MPAKRAAGGKKQKKEKKASVIAALALYGRRHCAVHGAETGWREPLEGGGGVHAANYINHTRTVDTRTHARREVTWV